MDTPQVRFREINLTDQVVTPVAGISFIRGKAIRGPFDQPDQVLSSWPQFTQVYGGFVDNDFTSILVKRLFDKGGKVRFSKIGHYTDIVDRATLTALKATPSDNIVNSDDEELFKLPLKYPGKDYDNIKFTITAGSNGVTGYFNLLITHNSDSNLTENYENLTLSGSLNPNEATFLQRVVEGSTIVDVQYLDLSALTGTTLPEPQVITHTGGDDGGAITDTDIIGDSSSNTGFHSFDEYDDSYQLMVVTDDVSDAVHIAGASYADIRRDLQYWAFLSNGLNNESALIAKRATLGFNTKYAAIFAGGLYVSNPRNSQTIDIEAITDIAALAVNSENLYGVWFSFAGNQRGLITNTLGVVNNFGTPAKFSQKNNLANRQINLIVKDNNSTKLWGQFTSQIESNQESFINIVRLVIYIKKSLKPFLENYLEEPNDIKTWELMYYQVKPFLDNLVDKRALFSYSWNGDQFAKSLDDLAVNRKVDVMAGKYKVKLILQAIASIQAIEVEITLTNGTLNIETLNPQ